MLTGARSALACRINIEPYSTRMILLMYSQMKNSLALASPRLILRLTGACPAPGTSHILQAYAVRSLSDKAF